VAVGVGVGGVAKDRPQGEAQEGREGESGAGVWYDSGSEVTLDTPSRPPPAPPLSWGVWTPSGGRTHQL